MESPNDNQLTTVRANARERAMIAADAREQGATWRQAADLAGFSDPANCIRAVRNANGSLPRVAIDEVREVWRERMEDLWLEALEDVRNRRPGAVRAAVAIAQRSAALSGLDAPTVTAFYTPTAQEKVDWLNNTLAALGAAPAQEATIEEVCGY